ncbi:MAG: hypothetical protein M1272_00100 [Firmicutes bacterium]|nr:hypothetical protein [Bacillota bacterium]
MTAVDTPRVNTAESMAWTRVLRWGFGLLWIIDGLLKLQPAMFTGNLISNVVGANATDNQPNWLYHLMIGGANVWHAGLPYTTIAMALFEMALGVGLIALRGRALRLTLWTVIAWSVVVWVMAEGMGGVLTGSPAFPGDSPGSTPFYVMGALLLLYPHWVTPRFHRWAGAFWGAAALVQCLPYNWTASNLAGIFGNVTMNGSEPAWVDRLNNAFIVLGFHHPVSINAILVLVMAVLAIGYGTGRIQGPIWTLTILWLVFLWAVPQAFGTLFTGTGTDLGNEFPLILLLWVAKDVLHRQPAG